MSKEAMKLALRVALENLDSTEPLGPTTEAVIDAAQKWYLAEQPAQQPTNCRHCGGADNVICAGQCRLQPAPVQQEQCPTCGEFEPRTGTCGASPNDKLALCNRNAPQPAQRTWVGLTGEEALGLFEEKNKP